MAHPVNWFQIGGPNGQQLQAFYESVFGWKMKGAPGPGDMQMVEPDKGGIPGGIMTTQNAQPSVAVYVGVGVLVFEEPEHAAARFGSAERGPAVRRRGAAASAAGRERVARRRRARSGSVGRPLGALGRARRMGSPRGAARRRRDRGGDPAF